MITKISNNQTVPLGELNLFILLSGTITIESDQKETIIKKQHFLLYDTRFEITSVSPYIDGFIISLPNIADDALREAFYELGENVEVNTPHKISDSEVQKELLNSMYKASSNTGLVNSYCHILITNLIEGIDNAKNDTSVYEQFCNLIDENIPNNYCAGEYAEMMDIPIRELIYEVRKNVDQTPCNVITGKVIAKAKDLIVNTTDSSKMIAYQLGFEDPYYFIKYFKKNVGHTPTQFRKMQLALTS